MIPSSFLHKRSQALGEYGQDLVHRELLRRGYKLVEPVYTPWKVIWKNGRPTHAFPARKVSGDFRAVEPETGRSVLVEVKYSDEGNLTYSTVKPHQHAALNEHSATTAPTFLVWVREATARFYQWPIPGFVPRASLKW